MKDSQKKISGKWFLVVFLLAASCVFSQQHNFTKYSVKEGIQSQVSCITQDSRGYMWIGTNNGGVALFDGKTFSYFTKENGLSNNNISAICEDKQGNIWIGTVNSGLDKYDGKKFIHYSMKDSAFTESSSIRNLFCDKKGNLWISTEDAVNIYDGKKFRWFEKTKSLSHRKAFKIFEDSKGNIWFGFKKGKSDGVDKYDGKTITHYKIKDLGSDMVSSFAEDKNGVLWLGRSNYNRSGSSLFFMEEDNFVPFNIGGLLDTLNIYDLIADRKGNLWMGTQGAFKATGFIRKNPSQRTKLNMFIKSGPKIILGKRIEGSENMDTVFMWEHFTKKYGLPDEVIKCVYEDREGNMWFGSNDGVIKYSNDAFVHYGQKEGLSEPVFQICQDKAGIMWTNNTSGLFVFNGDNFIAPDKIFKELGNKNIPSNLFQSKSGDLWLGSEKNGIISYNGEVMKYYTPAEPSRKYSAFPYYEDKSGNIWSRVYGKGVAVMKFSPSDGGKFSFYPDSGSVPFNVSTMIVDKQNSLWFCVANVGLFRYDGKKYTVFTEKNGLDDAGIRNFYEDKWGNLWVTTWADKGLFKYSENKFLAFNSSNGFSDEAVVCILEDKCGNSWFGTDGDGVFKFDGKTFTRYSTKEGLNNNTIMSLVNDDKGNLWAGTNKGINKITLDKNCAVLQIRPLGYNEGFTGIECNTNAAFKDNEGCLWFGTSTVLTKYSPKEDLTNSIPPQINLTGISLFYEKTAWENFSDSISSWSLLPADLSLPHNKNHLTFNFIGISHRSPQNVHYCFKMEGMDTAWSKETEKTEITFSNLSPGKYTFKVKARNENNYWSAPIAFSFEIQYPWYRTWGAYAGYVIGFFSILFGFNGVRTKQLKIRQQELEKTVKERTTELEEQKLVVEEKNKEVLDSIRYASRIQRALITSEKYIHKTLNKINNQSKK
ncbi:MAG: hypothetical protein IAF38_03330 [Bacteroidia bacterium]|nr:hypothetical protein [Bacteroidia bacterium]